MFDAVPEELRRKSGRKWRRHEGDVLAAWIADMDFAPAPAIRDTLLEAVEQGDFGYGPPMASSGVPQAFAAWARRRWGWAIDPAHVLLSPDVISCIFNCIEALTEPGDGVLVQTPVYGPFLETVKALGRRLVEAPLDGTRIDFDLLETVVRTAQPRILLLCNPHNPTGRVFTAEEMSRLGRIAREHELIVVSDEVHADLAYRGHRHLPFATLSPDAAARTVTLNSPSKAFNVAGLRVAVAVASDAGLMAHLRAIPANRWTPFSTLGVRAALAAWSEEGEEWLDACVARLESNRDLIARRLAAELPKVGYTPPEASYLAWLDFRELGLDDPAAVLLDRARVALSGGAEFGTGGEGHARLNFATSEAILNEILDRIAKALA